MGEIEGRKFALAIGLSGTVRRFPRHGGFAYLGSFRETVADVGVGEQVLGVRRVVFNLLAQLAHKGTQVIDFLAVVRAPDRSEQLAIGDRAAGMRSEEHTSELQ